MRIEKKWSIQNVPNKLSDNQMKNVVAGCGYGYDGYGGGYSTCAALSSSKTCSCSNTKAEALFWAGCDSNGNNCTGNWCCDGCSSSTWYSDCCD